jgi:hypothetical protein
MSDEINILKLHSRGRPILTCSMWNKKTPEGYEHPKFDGYLVSQSDNEIRVRIAKFGIRKFSMVDGYELGSRALGNGWRIDLKQLGQRYEENRKS